MLQSLQLHFDIKASMAEDEEYGDGQGAGVDEAQGPPSASKFNAVGKTAATYTFDTFDTFVNLVIVRPFAAQLGYYLIELATDLELSEQVMNELNER